MSPLSLSLQQLLIWTFTLQSTITQCLLSTDSCVLSHCGHPVWLHVRHTCTCTCMVPCICTCTLQSYSWNVSIFGSIRYPSFAFIMFQTNCYITCAIAELCFGAIFGNLGYVRKLPLMATCCLRKLPKVATSQQVAISGNFQTYPQMAKIRPRQFP